MLPKKRVVQKLHVKKLLFDLIIVFRLNIATNNRPYST